MANSQGKPHSGPAQGDVSSCVSNLVQAFANSLDVFKRLRERRQKRKNKKQQSSNQPEVASGDELQLSNALRRNPQDIQNCYQQHYGKAGERFAKGDAVAHSCLAETLLKLNAGLVSIIAAFLNHDSKSKHIDLDYKSLTNLSNTSRAEAVNSLNQLYQRLSRSQLQLYQIGQCQRCGRPTGTSKKHDCPLLADSGHHAKSRSDKRSRAGTRPRHNGPMVAKMPLKSSSQPQLVIVRPRNNRRTTSSSDISKKSQSTALSTYATPSLGPPPPLPSQYPASDPFWEYNMTAMLPPPTHRAQSNLADTWPQTRNPELAIPPPAPTPPCSSPRRQLPPPETHTPPQGQNQIPARRRTEKTILSNYTFASDSTKLGEIPEKHWPTPFDYAEAERLNAEAYAAGYPNYPGVVTGGGERKKRGLWGLLRKGHGGAVAA